MKYHHGQCLMDKGYHHGLNLVLCPSARGACKQCGVKMSKDQVKVGFGTGEEKLWLDLQCAAKALTTIVAGSGCTPKNVTEFTGFVELSAADQALAMEAFAFQPAARSVNTTVDKADLEVPEAPKVTDKTAGAKRKAAPKTKAGDPKLKRGKR